MPLIRSTGGSLDHLEREPYHQSPRKCQHRGETVDRAGAHLAYVISVFTPTHDPRHLDDCYASLQTQTHHDWEWVIAFNNDGQDTRDQTIADIGAAGDHRVTYINAGTVTGAGAAKAIACDACTGDIMVELDHDDVLRSDALEQVQIAFDTHPDIGFVYSHFAQVNADLTESQTPFSPEHGWTFTDTDFDGRKITRTNVLEPTPHNCAHIWYAPNHVRAWRADLYRKVGGYNPALTVLDDQDLMSRMFAETDFHLTDECLYLQRSHGRNTQSIPELNAAIQQNTLRLVDENIRPMALAWAARRALPLLSLTRDDAPDVFALLAATATSSVGVIEANDFLQHVADTVPLMGELHRVLVPSGMLLTATPSTDGRGAFQDPSHRSYWNPNRFWYHTDRKFADYLPANTARFQVSRLDSFYPSEWHETHNIPYVRANLIAFKDGPRNGGILNWP